MKAKNKLAAALLSASFGVLFVMRVSAAPDATVPGTYLDDFSRDTLLAPATGVALSDGTDLYWNQAGRGTFSIQDSILIAQCDSFGYYRFATSGGKRYAYCIFRIKGDSRAKNSLIYTRIASQGATDSGGISDIGGTSERLMDTLVGPDSLPVPEIDTEFQTIVVDMAKNGLQFGSVGGANAFQIGTHAPMELDIDYIFSSNYNPLDTTIAATKFSKSEANEGAVSGANVWVSNASKTIVIHSIRPGFSGTLSLYDLEGRSVRSFNVRAQGNLCRIPLIAASVRENVYLYRLTETSGAVLVKGRINLQ